MMNLTTKIKFNSISTHTENGMLKNRYRTWSSCPTLGCYQSVDGGMYNSFFSERVNKE